MLRAELAKRDRELLAASAARRRSADSSERAAAALRAKLSELEAVVAATPSASSRASSPHRSDAGSPVFCSLADRSIQTDLEAVSISTASDMDPLNLPPKAGGSTSSAPPHRRLPLTPTRQDIDIWDPEHMKAVISELFQMHDVGRCGNLVWKNGEVMKFLNDFFERHDSPPPRLPSAVFSNIYNQVKIESGHTEIDGLNVVEIHDFCKRIHDLYMTNRGLRGEMRERRPSATSATSSPTAGVVAAGAVSPAISMTPLASTNMAGASPGDGKAASAMAPRRAAPAAVPIVRSPVHSPVRGAVIDMRLKATTG